MAYPARLADLVAAIDEWSSRRCWHLEVALYSRVRPATAKAIKRMRLQIQDRAFLQGTLQRPPELVSALQAASDM